MAGIKKIALASALALAVSGCSMYKLEELRHTTPSGTPFQNALAKLYMDFASQEEKEYDWRDSWHFADKGLSLAYGKDAGPEELANWEIPEAVLPEMENARASLMAALTPDLMRVSPSRAAEAQFYFDCWVEQQEENWQEEDIAYCRDNLMLLLAELDPRRMAAAVPQEPAAKPARKTAGAKEKLAARKTEPEEVKVELAHESGESAMPDESMSEPEKPKTKPKPAKRVQSPEKAKEADKPDEALIPESTSYAVFFETNKAEVSEPGMNVITEIIKSVSGASDYVIILHTSKDRPGMAAERIHVIRKLLAAGGIKENAIKIGNGKVETDTSVRRRVEIFLNE